MTTPDRIDAVARFDTNARLAWIEQQREQGWPDCHPEDYCHRCGAPNPMWWTDHPTWTTATATWAAETGREGICCPNCLTAMHEAETDQRPLWNLANMHDPAAIAALAATLAERHPDQYLTAGKDAGVLEEDDDVEWCEERCYASTYSSPYTCGDRCNLPGPHERHECVDGHRWDVEADDHHPKRSRRLVSEWREVEPE